ncbi:MAG: hypothetical protein ABI862_06250, partial [Ilumatobacteraceae bacterium]
SNWRRGRTPRLHTTAPELDDLLRLLAVADEHDELLAPVLNLGATTGLRRGEDADIIYEALNGAYQTSCGRRLER